MPGGITLDLQEGFAGDEVHVRAAGIAELRLDAVRTRLQTGRARSLALPAGISWLELELPRRGIFVRIDLLAARPLWVGVSLAGEPLQLQAVQQSEPFGYA
jgi:hypothetical protein